MNRYRACRAVWQLNARYLLQRQPLDPAGGEPGNRRPGDSDECGVHSPARYRRQPQINP